MDKSPPSSPNKSEAPRSSLIRDFAFQSFMDSPIFDCGSFEAQCPLEDDEVRSSGNMLFSLIQGLQWNEALSRMTQHPQEVPQWIVKHDGINKTGKIMLWRRLPLHDACTGSPPTMIISSLLEIFPAGAKAEDNQGRTPLHHAVIHFARIECIYLLLNANYDAIYAHDFLGRIPADYLDETQKYTTHALTKETEGDVAMKCSKIMERIRKEKNILNAHKKELKEVETKKEEPEIIKIPKEEAVAKIIQSAKDDIQTQAKTQSETKPKQLIVQTREEEEIAQALVEQDIADSIDHVSQQSGNALKKRVDELEASLEEAQTKKAQEMDELLTRIIYQRYESEMKLTAQVKEANATSEKDLTKKDEEIKDLRAQLDIERQHRKGDILRRVKLKNAICTLAEKLKEQGSSNSDNIEHLMDKKETDGVTTEGKGDKQTLKNNCVSELSEVHVLRKELASTKKNLTVLRSLAKKQSQQLFYFEENFHELTGRLVDKTLELKDSKLEKNVLEAEVMILKNSVEFPNLIHLDE